MTTTTLDEFETAGIAAMVRAGEAKQWFFGHFGATLISGARLLRNPSLPGPAALALSARLTDFVEAHQEWYAPLDVSDRTPRPLEPLVKVLRRGAGSLRTSGHSTIYVSAALEVLHRQHEGLSGRVLDGLIMLHAAGRADDPARYYGVEDYFAELERSSNAAPKDARDSVGAFRMAIASLDHLVADREIDGRHYFLTGEKIHLLTHAHAIATLERLGLADIAARAMVAQTSLARLVDASRVLAPTEIEPAGPTPFDASFWQQSVPDPAHLIKVAETVVSEIPRLPEEERIVALERLARVWALLGIR
jgi:hypothetical protein